MMRIRDSGLRATTGRVAVAALLAATATAAPLAAQVGNAPGRSPFHDLTVRQSFTLAGGRFGGNTAAAGVGWRAGLLTAVRLDTRLAGPLDFYVSFGTARSSRYRINTELDPLTRKSGPFKKTLFLTDLGLILNVTGAKTWHGIAPYVGLGGGWVLPSATEIDTGGYKAGSNLALVPSLGTRIFFSRSLAARIEVRDYLFRYEWPRDYFVVGVLDANVWTDRQWTHNIALTVGLCTGSTSSAGR
jgi:hypothetical protein